MAADSREIPSPPEPATGSTADHGMKPDGGVLAEEVAAVRARRRAEEAARAAAVAVAAARRAEHARDLAEVRRHLDEERLARARQLEALAAQRAAERTEPAKPAAPVAAAGDAQARRDEARARLRAEAARVAAELATLDAEAATQAEREEELRRSEAALEAESRRAAAEHQALAEAMQRELDEIDQRLEARFGAASSVASPPPSAAPSTPQTPPPPPQPRMRLQRKARLVVSASALIDHFGTLVTLPLINVSLTGALISTQGTDLPSMRVGQMLLITLFATEDASRQVDLCARVVRRTEHDAAVDWSDDFAATHGVARLLEDLTGQA